MNMRKRWTVLGAVLAAAVALSAVLAGAGMHHGAHGHDAMIEQMLDDLDVSDTQRARLLGVKERLLPRMQALHGHHEAVHHALLSAWESERMDAAALHGLVDARLEELRAALHDTVNGVVEIHETLTPDQRRRLTARVKELHGTP